MATIRKTITLTTSKMIELQLRLKNGSFTKESEYIGDLVRRDQSQNAEFIVTKVAIEYRFKSGISDMDVPYIMKK